MTNDEKLDVIINKIDNLETEIKDVKMSLETEIQDVKTSLRTEITDLRLILENEIRPNIGFIADGHLDLYRNMHDAVKSSGEMEMINIRMDVLESRVRKLESQAVV